ncbi:hypothetical protein [Gorillibacterium timonense]|uniref:hypothetical protein n=1 Tax=Gorillibacterium timonense TaxID=1689269 RepID=UPI00071D778F|nr:hypothetical protein [Gorillibacterium timonense]
MKSSENVLPLAKEFIYRSARLLDRRRFEYHFEGGSREAVISVLRAYQNLDGGFGSAFEPDLRGPHSQPVATEEALLILDELGGGEPDMLARITAFVGGITREGGGVPQTLIQVQDYPHAPWWETEEDSKPALNPTGRLIGLLFKLGAFAGSSAPDWHDRTLAFLWKQTETVRDVDYHDWIQVLSFLVHVPDRERAVPELERVGALIRSSGVIELDPYAAGYVHPILEWAPAPGSLCRSYFTDEQVEQHLDALIETQNEDGGWSLSFPTLSTAADGEWRSYLTMKNLLILRAYGRI